MAKQLTIREQAKEIFDLALPELGPTDLEKDRIRSSFLAACVRDPSIVECDRRSVISCILKSADDGILCDGRTGAIVPFYDKKNKRKVAAYIPMVQGIIARMHDLGGVLSVTANCVHANDVFEVNEAVLEDTRHIRPPLGEDRGELCGAYVIFRNNNNQVVHREIMTKREIEKARQVSKMAEGGVWNNWTAEMYRKTVIRRGSKYVPLSNRMRRIIEREDEYVDFDRLDEIEQRPSIESRLKGQKGTEGFTKARPDIENRRHLDDDQGIDREAEDATVEDENVKEEGKPRPTPAQIVESFETMVSEAESAADLKSLLEMDEIKDMLDCLPEKYREKADKIADDRRASFAGNDDDLFDGKDSE